MIELLNILNLIIDSGVLVFIWLIQIVIYPGLAVYEKDQLKKIHPIYTQRISFFVIPLLLSQCLLSSWIWIYSMTWLASLKLIFIGIALALTFIKAVPLHKAIEQSPNPTKQMQKLIQMNWTRTILWTMTWGLSLATIFNS